MSRPEKQIDWAKVDHLLMAGCAGTQIAPHFDMHEETFYIKVKEKYNMGFTAYCALKRKHGDSLLLAKQFEKALKGDNTLLIWLGKTRLEQREVMANTNVSPIQDQIDLRHQLMLLKAENAELTEKLNANKSQTG
jgi:hypothetical protein